MYSNSIMNPWPIWYHVATPVLWCDEDDDAGEDREGCPEHHKETQGEPRKADCLTVQKNVKIIYYHLQHFLIEVVTSPKGDPLILKKLKY